MNYNLTNRVLTFELIERIDSSNAEQVSEEFTQNTQKNGHDSVVLDAKKLQYISSAGLRALLKLKKAENNLSITNVCEDVYEVFDMTGFTQIINVSRS